MEPRRLTSNRLSSKERESRKLPRVRQRCMSELLLVALSGFHLIDMEENKVHNELPQQTLEFQDVVKRWAAMRVDWPREGHLFDRKKWTQVVDLGLLDAELDGGTI